MSFFEFPHTRTYDSDLGAIIKHIDELLACCTEMQTWRDEFSEEYQAVVQELRDYVDAQLSSQNISATVAALLNDYISAGLMFPYIDGKLEELVNEAVESMYQGRVLDVLTDVNSIPFDLIGGRYIDVWTISASAYYTTNERASLYMQIAAAENKLKQAEKPKNYPNSYLTQPETLSLLHFSDIHGDAEETARIYVRFVKLCGSVDNIICTGDMVPSYSGQDVTYLNSYQYGKLTLRCLGNHDVYATPTPDLNNQITQAEEYTKYFAGYIQNWDVTYTDGLTYYYKDYTQKNIRLICLNDTLLDTDMTAQISWLAARLTEAQSGGMAVLIAIHNVPGGNITPIKCTFTRPDLVPAGYMTAEHSASILNTVQAFLNSGGTFIGYLCGHWHSDYVGYYTDYPQQTFYMVSAASVEQCNAVGDYDRIDDTISADLFNLVVADTSTDTFKMIRVGADYTSYMQHVDTLCINYKTHEIISNN